MIGLALTICGLGSYISMSLIARTNRAGDILRAAWVFLAAIVVGITAWATHFIALLGYLGGAQVTYDPAFTMASLMLAIVGASFGIGIAAVKAHGPLPAVGGVLLGLSVAGMHYVGMLAYQVESTVRWHSGCVIASILLAAGLGALTLAALRSEFGGQACTRISAALLAATILSLHFTGMSALEIIPLTATKSGGSQNEDALALSIALGAGLIFVIGLLNYAIDRQTRRHAENKLAALERTDALTGLPNRLAANEELEKHVRLAMPHEFVAVLAIELLNIDAIGQQFGSALADRVIQATSTRLIDARKTGFVLARVGGSQFYGVGPVSDPADTLFLAQKMQTALSQDLLIEARDIQVDIRIGAVTFPSDAVSAESLIRKAHVALARAVADPLEPVALHDEKLDVTAQRRLALANDLRGALERHEFELFYQPQVWIDGRRIIGYEALIRWRHPQLGMVSPAEFIPMAERTGLILPIGDWVLRTACEEATKWPKDFRVAVNLSPLQLRQADLPLLVSKALSQSGLEPDRLEIELTESLLVSDRLRALEIFNNIRSLKVRLVLDDFGTGYSSMEVLRQFPFDKIKLDRSFVGEIETNDQSRAILYAMLTLGKELSMPILVEGVETEHQLMILRKYGCNKVQGYFTGRPAPSASMTWRAPDLLSA